MLFLCRSMSEMLATPKSSASATNFFLNAPGQSGKISSPHYSSALAAWSSGEMIPFSFGSGNDGRTVLLAFSATESKGNEMREEEL